MDNLNCKKLMNIYRQIRYSNFKYKFSRKAIEFINFSRKHHKDDLAYNNPLLLFGDRPSQLLDNKGVSDYYSIKLWNEIMSDNRFTIKSLEDIKESASNYIEYYNATFDFGKTSSEIDDIRFITSFSSSSFFGIQSPKYSRMSYDSMVKSLTSHNNHDVKHKPWLIPNLSVLINHMKSNPSIMQRSYADLCLNAKMSSASIPGVKYYRDYVLEHVLTDAVRSMDKGIEYVLYAGSRLDRRGKYRAIFSTDANFRIIDFLINNGSYQLCEKGGIFAKYTTEGYNTSMMWKTLSKMSSHQDKCMVCIDYTGYDTQISMDDYLQISRLLNEHRLNDPDFRDMFNLYESWMLQPKPLVVRSAHEIYPILPLFDTLPSGLHGTHSFENLIGISTYFEALNRGIKALDFWANGDDQNILIDPSDKDKFVDFIGEYFDINWQKSLVGHKLIVWAKNWFCKTLNPTIEIGTFRSLWEREGSSFIGIEESKFEANYCKILQVAMILIRLNKSDSTVQNWIIELCNECDPKIDHTKIPIKLQNLRSTKSSSHSRNYEPEGLKSVKSELMGRNFDLRMFGINNYYDMMLSIFKNRVIFKLDVYDVKYYPSNTILRIETGYNYTTVSNNVPFMFKRLVIPHKENNERSLIANILQTTKSYDGPVFKEYKFHDMLSLSHALCKRNADAWNLIQK